MKVLFACIFFIFLHLGLKSQEVGVLRILNDTAQIELEEINVDVQIIGNIATTVTTLTFYNPNDRILEGELSFPLAEGQSIFRFAMDVNGKLREGVIVEKIKGRQAFEGVVRQNIDPGLLEKTIGNNYKARIYPIPAKGRKTILIGCEEVLRKYPAQYKFIADYDEVKDFSLNVNVVNQEFQPIIKKNDLNPLKFSQWQNSYRASVRRKNFKASGVLSFDIPMNLENQVFREKDDNGDYFYATVASDAKVIQKKLPNSLAIIWDASKSSESRDTSKETDLIEKYIEMISDVEIRLIVFSSTLHENLNFSIKNGNSKELLDYLRQIVFDGGTSFKSLKHEFIGEDEVLLFSDGVSNISLFEKWRGSSRVNVLCSSHYTDFDFARRLANNTGGTFINLLNTDIDDALLSLSTIPYQYLGLTMDGDVFKDVYPEYPENISSPLFSIAGRVKSNNNESLILHFGVGDSIMESRKIKINERADSINVGRLWAKQKIENISKSNQSAENEIIDIAKEYGLVTEFTSLIVLDRVEDYVINKIDPPEELRAEYDRLMAEEAEAYETSQERIIKSVLDNYEDRMNWWLTNEKDSTSQETTDRNVDSVNTNRIQEDLPPPQRTISTPVDTNIYNIRLQGHVSDVLGQPLIGATVMLKGTSIGAITDFEGAFGLNAREDDILVFSYTGYATKEAPVTEDLIVNVKLAVRVDFLEEVVVTGLAGRAEGVSLSSSATSVVIRGASQINNDGAQLIIVDGVIAETSDLSSLVSDNINSINILKGVNAISLYGSGAKNGVIIITTNKGIESGLVNADTTLSAINAGFEIIEWEPTEPYLDIIREVPLVQQYKTYLSLREEYGSAPSFYIVVGRYFLKNNQLEIGQRVLSNIAELSLENHELLKMLAHAFLQEGMLNESIFLFEKIYELRPDEIQSKRDLALAYQLNGENQEALNLFNSILTSDWQHEEDRFPEIRSIVLTEMNNLISSDEDLDLTEINEGLILEMAVDVRIVLGWNNLETDLDLWITEPNGERCGYSNPLTKLGGKLSEDNVDGYGPEEYLLKTAVEGEYKIEVDYYDERVQKLSGPVSLQVSIYTHYGTKKEKVRRLTRELKKVEDKVEIGAFIWGGED